MTGPVAEGNERIGDLVGREMIVVAPLIALLLVLGLPQPVLDITGSGGREHHDHHRPA